MQNYTPEQTEDINTRMTEFVKEYQDLTKKWQMDFLGLPIYIPTSSSSFGTSINLRPVDTKYMSKPTPFKLAE